MFSRLEAEKKVLKKVAKIFGSSRKSSTFAVPFASEMTRGQNERSLNTIETTKCSIRKG